MNSPASTQSPLTDQFGRIADDLRISVTDRCNFRCVYCMPAEGLQWVPKSKLLSFEEITRVAGVLVDLGVRTIRLTGGEPTLRRELSRLVSMLAGLHPDLDLAMTTNGFLLKDLAGPLAEAGLKRVNVSVDSLMKHRFAEITRRDALSAVMEGIKSAEAAGLGPIKLNCVVVRGTNDDEVVDFARLARDTGWEIRFIEFMPLDAEKLWDSSMVVSAAEITDSINRNFPLVADSTEGRPEPASTWHFADGSPGKIGVIPSVSQPFCETCNRIRITADGQLRTCLFSLAETDLKRLLRGGASDVELTEALGGAIWTKQAGHRINQADFVRPARSMSMIGG
ncbi:MAG: GTP 3',8-cyclase MoaA [Actinomycetota bacterium]